MKIPKAKKLPSGSWRVQVMVEGNRYSIVEDTKEVAERKAMLLKLQSDHDEESRKKVLKAITISDAIDNYISDTQNVLSASTIRSYRSMQAYRFQSVMDLPLTAHINWQSVVNAEANETVKKRVKTKDPDQPNKTIDTGKKLSAKTIINAWGLIQTVLNYYHVPYGDVRLPQLIKTEHLFLEPDDISIFLAAIKDHRFEMEFLLCLHGLRRSEMIDVRKSDIIYGERPMIRVSGSRVYDEKNQLIEKAENKTVESARKVPIMIPRLLDLLEDVKDDAYLCTHNPNSILHPLNTVCRQNELPEVGLHGLRHTFASLCYHLKIPEMVTQKWGGWKDPNVVRRIYAHLAKKDENDSFEKMNLFFANSV